MTMLRPGTRLRQMAVRGRAMAGVSAWEPSSVDGLYADWRSVDIASIGAGWTDRVSGRTFSSTTAAPTLVSDVVGTKPAVRFDGVDDHWRSSSFTLPQPYTIYTVAQHGTTSTSGRLYDGNTVNQCVLNVASDVTVTAHAMFAGSVSPSGVAGAVVPDVYAAVFNGASSSLTCGRRAVVTGNPGTSGPSAGMILGAAGNLSGGFFAAYDLGHLLIYDVAHDSTQRAAVLAGLASLWPVKPSLRFEGDSNTQGTGTSAGMSYPDQTLALLGGSSAWSFFNGGLSGDTIAAMKLVYPTDFGRYTSRLGQNVQVLMAGTNDIIGGATAATVYADLQVWWAAARAAGAQVVAVDLFNRINWTAPQRAEAVSLNGLIASDTALYHALVQVSADSRFDMSDPAVSADGVHLTDLSAGWLAEMVADAITPLL